MTLISKLLQIFLYSSLWTDVYKNVYNTWIYSKKEFFRNHLETCCYKLLPSCLLLSSCTVLMETTIHDHKRHIFEWDSRCVCDKWTQLKTFFLISNSYIFTPPKIKPIFLSLIENVTIVPVCIAVPRWSW